VLESQLAHAAPQLGARRQEIVDHATSGNAGQTLQALPPSLRGPVEHALRLAFVEGFDRILWIAAAIIFAGAIVSLVLVHQKDVHAEAGGDVGEAEAAAATAILAPDGAGVVEIELVRPRASEAESRELLKAVERDTRSRAAEPGFLSGCVHISDDETIVACWQWADDGAASTARAHDGITEQLAETDVAAYEVAYVHARDEDRITIEAGGDYATLIDVMRLDDPSRQAETLELNIMSSEGLSSQPGFRSTSVLRGRDGTRIATYSQWERVEDWIAAVRSRAGQDIAGLEDAESVDDVNAALEKAGHQTGVVPEYHAYRVTSVIRG
jgi:hypothetical protein